MINSTVKQIRKNVLLSVSAQIISLGTSFILNLILPKFLPEFQYSMWQIYVLYASFVGICHLGLLDGFILRYSEYDYNTLNKTETKVHLLSLIFISGLFSIIVLLSGSVIIGFSRQILYLVSCAVIVKNLSVFVLYTCQSTNRIKCYAKLIIIQRIIYAVAVVLLLIMRESSFLYYCIADILADFIVFLWSFKYNIAIYCAKVEITNKYLKIVQRSLACGIVLMLANFSNNFIIGACKIAVERTWNELIFGKVAFAFSVTNLFLSFIVAISVVLFPSLKRMDIEYLNNFYGPFRVLLTEILYICLLLYFPLIYIIEKWLPNYCESLYYLGILFPIILFTVRTTLLTNNYMKVFRLEKSMLAINAMSVLIEIGGLLVICFKGNLLLVLYWTMFVTFFKSLLSERIVCAKIKISYYKITIQEVVLAVLFIILSNSLDYITAFICLSFAVLCVSVSNKARIKEALRLIV